VVVNARIIDEHIGNSPLKLSWPPFSRFKFTLFSPNELAQLSANTIKNTNGASFGFAGALVTPSLRADVIEMWALDVVAMGLGQWIGLGIGTTSTMGIDASYSHKGSYMFACAGHVYVAGIDHGRREDWVAVFQAGDIALFKLDMLAGRMVMYVPRLRRAFALDNIPKATYHIHANLHTGSSVRLRQCTPDEVRLLQEQ
jgi:hypothetical protein